MLRQHWKHAFARIFTGFVTAGSVSLGTLVNPLAHAQSFDAQVFEARGSVPAGLRGASPSDAGPIQYLRFAHFTIPFEVASAGRAPSEVQLWVSPDAGQSWMKYGSSTPDKRAFEFHAAAEGEYLFAVQTLDGRGEAAVAATPSMRVVIDTSKPELQLQADVNSSGRLVIDYQIADSCLSRDSVRLSYCADDSGQWTEVQVASLENMAGGWRGRSELEMPRARDIAIKLIASDLAQNTAEANARFNAPRTASASSGLQLASQRGDSKDSQRDQSVLVVTGPASNSSSTASSSAGISSRKPSPATQAAEKLAATHGAVPWNPSSGKSIELTQRSNGGWSSTTPIPPITTARTISVLPENQQHYTGGAHSSEPSTSANTLFNDALGSNSQMTKGASLEPGYEELPLPAHELQEKRASASSSALDVSSAPSNAPGSASNTASDGAYHSRSRSFSLDYSIDSLRGMAVSDIELWGTEDGGITWQKWGSDPDRESPFDVQVAADGQFGFRMVIIAANGLVSNRPHDGDAADMIIHVDTDVPRAKITRALYGEGAEAGMVIIDYNCEDGNLHERPITLSYSERPSGPWVTIAGGLANTGSYSWKAGPGLPQQVYVRIQAVDRAGNTTEHRLELPINLRGLTPRGRIQGVRPIDPK